MYLWLDLWDKMCWIAVYVEWIVIPKDIVLRVKLVDVLKKYIKDYKIKTIVVWLPYDLYWKNLKQLDKTKKFIEKIQQIFSWIEVVWFDERFTSFEASNILNSYWKTDWVWKKDDISACLILEDYLKSKNIY